MSDGGGWSPTGGSSSGIGILKVFLHVFFSASERGPAFLFTNMFTTPSFGTVYTCMVVYIHYYMYDTYMCVYTLYVICRA